VFRLRWPETVYRCVASPDDELLRSATQSLAIRSVPRGWAVGAMPMGP
jgi:hypothetical protein